MRAIRILDQVTIQAACSISDVLARDLADCDAALADKPMPTALVAHLEGRARDLAELAFLDLWDDVTSGRIDGHFDYDNHFDDMATSFANRMNMTMRFMPAVPLEWLLPCSYVILAAFRKRINLLGAAGPAGGAA